MKFILVVDDSETAKLPLGVLEKMLYKEMTAQLERVFLYGTSAEKEMLGTIGDFLTSSDARTIIVPPDIIQPPRRKGPPPSRDARKDRWR